MSIQRRSPRIHRASSLTFAVLIVGLAAACGSASRTSEKVRLTPSISSSRTLVEDKGLESYLTERGEVPLAAFGGTSGFWMLTQSESGIRALRADSSGALINESDVLPQMSLEGSSTPGYVDSGGDLWIATIGSLVHFDAQGPEVSEVVPYPASVSAAAEKESGPAAVMLAPIPTALTYSPATTAFVVALRNSHDLIAYEPAAKSFSTIALPDWSRSAVSLAAEDDALLVSLSEADSGLLDAVGVWRGGAWSRIDAAESRYVVAGQKGGAFVGGRDVESLDLASQSPANTVANPKLLVPPVPVAFNGGLVADSMSGLITSANGVVETIAVPAVPCVAPGTPLPAFGPSPATAKDACSMTFPLLAASDTSILAATSTGSVYLAAA